MEKKDALLTKKKELNTSQQRENTIFAAKSSVNHVKGINYGIPVQRNHRD